MSAEADAIKRELETDPAEEPATKRTKTEAESEAAAEQQETIAEAASETVEGANHDADEDTAGDHADEAAGDHADDAADEAETAGASGGVPPIKLGYRTFKSGSEASDYFSEILKKSKPGERLNEYEVLMLLDLLQKGHPRASEKLAKGVKGFRVDEMRVGGSSSTCFHIEALDGTLEDFSYRKCLSALFADYTMKESTNKSFRHRGPPGDRRDSGSGGRGRGGRSGRGRGGRGSGRGRGRGRY